MGVYPRMDDGLCDRPPPGSHLARFMRLCRRCRTRTYLPKPLLLTGQNALPQRGNAALRLRRDQAVALIVEAAELGGCVVARTRAKASLIASRHSMTCPISCSRV